MAIQPPSPANFSYKKYSGFRVPTQQLYFPNILNAVTDFKQINFINVPRWLRIFNLRFEGFDAYLDISINPTVADNLSPRTHTETIQFLLYTTEIDAPGVGITTPLGNYTVNLTVSDTVRLSISPTTFSFSYDDGDPAPLDKELTIRSENDWTIVPSESWVTLSQDTGNGNGEVMVGVDIAGLDFGFYEAIVTINDGFLTASFTIYLTVNVPAETTDYIFLNPQNLEFLSQVGISNATQKKLIVDAGNNWTLSANKPWIQLSSLSGASGITEVLVSVDSDELAAGIYSAQLTATSAGIVKKAFIVLRVVTVSVTGLLDNGVYFADDRVYLMVGSIGDNSFLRLEIEASSEGKIKNYPKEQPYFKGIARALIGSESRLLIDKTNPLDNFVTGPIPSPKPLVLNIAAFEQNRFDGETSNVANYSNVRFLRGSTPPVANRLCNIPSQITLSSKGVVAIHVRADLDPGNIVLTGAIEQNFIGASPNNELIYSCFVNLSDFTLETGDVLDISYGGQTVQVVIDDDIVESNIIGFENKWGLIEYFETKGFMSKIASTRRSTYEVAKEGKNHTKVLEAPKSTSFRVNTGNIMTQQEVAWMMEMMYSERIYIYQNGEPIEVLMQNTREVEDETRRRVMNFNLDFKTAIE